MTRLDQDQLLEREAEVAALARLVDRARRGEGGVALLEGPAGIGKSALLQRGLDLAAEAGFDGRHARGSELEGDYPFGIVRRLFEPLVTGLPAEEQEALFAGAAALARPVFPAIAGTAGASADDDAFATMHGLYWLSAELASRQPLALAVDDAHWADLPSLRLLSYLANRAEELPLLLVVAARPARGARGELLDDLAVNPTTEVLRPAPLGRSSVARLLAARLGSDPEDEFIDACLAATKGNPFFLTELGTALAVEGVAPVAREASLAIEVAAPTVARSVVRRLGRLSPEALRVARAIAVLGAATERRTVAALTDLEPAAVAAATDALVRAEVLRPDGLDFAHPLVRSAIYAELGPGERASMHARAAKLVSSSGAGDADVAIQLLAGAPAGDPWAVEVLRRAAREARSRGAPDVAATYLERALAEPPPADERAEVLRELGLAQAVAHGPEGFEFLRQSMAVTEDRVRRSTIALELARLLFMQSFFPQCADVVQGALRDLDGDHPELTRQLEAQLFIVALTDLGVLSRVGGLERLAARIRERDLSEDRPALAALAWIEAVAVPPAENGARLAMEALAGLGLSREQDASVLAGSGPALMAAGKLQEAKAIWDFAAAESRRRGSLAALAFCLIMSAPVEIRLGRPAVVEAGASELIELVRELGTLGRLRVPYAWGLAPLIDALLERGDVAGAEKAVEESPIGSDLPELLQFNYLLHSLGRLRLAQGRNAEAVDLLRECGRRLGAWGVRNPGLVSWRSTLATALVASDEREEAAALADEEVALAREFEVQRELGVALRVSGLVRGGDQGLARLEEAAAVLEVSPAILDRARALTDFGSALRRRGNRADAREPLRRGLDLAQRSGATALARHTHTELVATGARPRKLVLSGAEALTASERRVAELAAQGLTNRRIAEDLFVTEKTVEGHLRQAYRKLDIASRTQLREALVGSEDDLGSVRS